MALKEPEPKNIYTARKKNMAKKKLFKRHHTNFTFSLRLAGVRTNCSRKNRERGIPCSDKTFLFKEVDGCTNQNRVG